MFQAADKIGKITGEQCDIEMAAVQAMEDCQITSRARVVVASVQSMNSKRKTGYRMERFNPHDFGLILTDECHHATANGYRRIYEWFDRNPDICHLGVTATPDRTDEEALGQIFDSVAFEYGIVDAIDDGWLVPIEQQFVHVEGLDLSNCKSHKSDLQDSDVARVMEAEKVLHEVVAPTIEIAGDRQTLVFAASVAHAERMAEIFNRHRDGSAVCITGETPTEERREQLKRYSRGEFQYLTNMGVFLEGFDEPRIGVVAMARPTKSRALYAQTIGRGTRPLPGIVDAYGDPIARRSAIAGSEKPSLLVLDFVGNSGKHKLVSTADILGGNEELDEVLDRAVSNAKRKGGAADMRKEIDDAREELLEEQRRRRAAITAKAKYNTQAISPFDVFDVRPAREPGWFKGKLPTEKMKGTLAKFKIPQEQVEKMSYFQAKQMLDTCINRMKNKLCTYKQAKLLSKFGFPSSLTFEEASAEIDKLAKNNWRRT